jgi:hypothetical protein
VNDGFRRVIRALLILLATAMAADAAPPPDSDQLVIATASTSGPLGKVTLMVDPLTRKEGGYSGRYQVKALLGIGSETGVITIVVSDESLAKLVGGDSEGRQPISFKGKAVNDKGQVKQVDGRATPASAEQGAIKVRVTSGKLRLVFDTHYRFSRKSEAVSGKL